MSTSYTPTSNWTDRNLAGRDLNTRPNRPRPAEPAPRPDEPRSFEARETAMAATPATVSAPTLADDVAYTPAYARQSQRRGDMKPWLIALPAVLAGAGLIGWMVLSPGSGEAVMDEQAATGTPVLESSPMIVGEPLAGMPITDLGAPPAPVPVEAEPTPTAARTPAPARARAPSRAAPAPAPAVEAEPAAAAAPVAEAAPEPVRAPDATLGLIVATEPLTLPD